MRFLILLFFIFTFCQNQNVFGQNSSEMPKAPDVAALNKYIDFPVDKSTGTMSISVPIYVLKTKSLELPISLSYHTGGIKVNEMASSVGLGWALNAGGTISRSIKSLPDEAYYSNRGFSPIQFPGLGSHQFVTYGKDLEPDVFYYNVNGYSGKFVMDKYHQVHTIPEQDIKIFLDTTVNSTETFTKWSIVTPDGNRYNFEGVYDHGKTYDGSFEAPYDQGNYISAWHLSSIITESGETINFQYQMDSYHNRVNLGNSSIIKTNVNPCITPSTISADSWVSGNVLRRISTDNAEIWFNNKTNLREDVEPESNYSKALDNIEIKDIASGNTIKTVKFITSYFQSNDNLAHSPTLGIGNNIEYVASPYQQKRLRLDEIKEFSGSGSFLPGYKFAYNKNNPIPITPNRLSNGQDHWGYYNGQSQNLTLIGKYNNINNQDCSQYLANRNVSEQYKRAFILDDITFPTGGVTKIYYDSISGISAYPGLRVKKVNTFSGETAEFLEKKFTYSGWHITGGPPVYLQHPMNTSETGHFNPNVTDFNAPIRIAADNATSVYGIDDNYFHPNMGTIDDIYLATGSPVNYSGELAGYHVYYDQVVEYQTKNGSIESNYSTDEVDDYIPDSDIYPLIFNKPAVKVGKLLSELVRNENGDLIKQTDYTYDFYYRRIIKSNDAAKLFNSPGYQVLTFYNLYTGSAFLTKKEVRDFVGAKENKTTTTFGYDGIPASLKDQAWTTNINQAHNMPNHQMLSLEKISLNDDNFKINRTKYVADFKEILKNTSVNNNFDNPTMGLKQALISGSTALPVEQLSTLVKNGQEKIVGGKLFQYQGAADLSGTMHSNLKMVSELEIESPIIYSQGFGATASITGGIWTFNNHIDYSPKTIFDFYDDKNNPIQYHQHRQPNTSTIWGYKKSAPIAQIKNAAKDEFYYEGFEETDQPNIMLNELLSHTGSRYYSGYLLVNWVKPNAKDYIIVFWYFQDGAWKYAEQSYTGATTLTIGSAYDDICIYPADAQLTFISQKVNVGTTSITDARGQTSYYEYDNFNRLSTVKDNSKDIVSASVYHYNTISTSFQNSAFSTAYQKNNCPNQAVGTSVTYLVPAGRYSSPFSQQEADDMAVKDAEKNGQSYANAHGECTGGTQLYYNDEMSQSFTPNCVIGQSGDETEFIVDAGEFSSTVSKADANSQAWQKLQQEGQAQANQTCRAISEVEWESQVSDGNVKVSNIKFYNASSNNLAFEISASQLSNMYDTHHVNTGNYNIVVQVQGQYYDGNNDTGYSSLRLSVSTGATTIQQLCSSHPEASATSTYTFNNVNLGDFTRLKFNILSTLCN